MSVSVSDPKVSVRDLLANNWDNTNTAITEDPQIHTGWYNSSWEGKAQVTITNANEGPAAGGHTGFRGISGAGDGSKIMQGDLSVGCWATREMYSGVNPKQLSFDLSEEVKRIMLDDPFAVSDLGWVTWVGRTEIVETDADPVLFRYDCTIHYQYIIDTG